MCSASGETYATTAQSAELRVLRLWVDLTPSERVTQNSLPKQVVFPVEVKADCAPRVNQAATCTCYLFSAGPSRPLDTIAILLCQGFTEPLPSSNERLPMASVFPSESTTVSRCPCFITKMTRLELWPEGMAQTAYPRVPCLNQQPRYRPGNTFPESTTPPDVTFTNAPHPLYRTILGDAP